MAKSRIVWLAALTVFVFSTLLTACADLGGNNAPEPKVRARSVYVTATAMVKAVDQARRELALVLPDGKAATLVVDQKVTRFAEIKPGDKVSVEYYFSVAAEVREPTAAELASPLEQVVGEVKAPPSAAPAGAALRQIRAVVTVVAVDKPGSKVLVTGPRGNYLEIEVADQKLLDRLSVGQKSVLTFTEALALSVEKVQ